MTSILLDKKPEIKLVTSLDLSVSKIKTFHQCAKQFRYLYIEKIPRIDFSFHIFGKYLHLVLELFHQELLKDSEQNKLELMSSCQDKAMEVWGAKLSQEDKEETYQILQKYLTRYTESLKNPVQPSILGLEKQFYISINDVVLLNGFIDLLKQDPDGIYSVEDYKSTKDKKYLKDTFQLQVYAYATYLMFPNIKKVRGKYILLRHNFETIDTEFSLKDILAVEPKLLAYAEEIKSEKLFRPNPTPLCQFCSAEALCEEKWIKPDKKKKSVNIPSKTGACDW